jgi:hypothetical protein
MSDTWRRKSYYRPRVLVGVDDVLDSDFPDVLCCLTGGQVNLLRNLLQYALRRSTWVSEYHDSYYLAPTEAEWEQLEDVVAELEVSLVGCDDIVAQLNCICNAIKGLGDVAAPDSSYFLEDQPTYDNEDSSVEEDTGSPPVSSTWDDWRAYRCKGAQMIVDDAVDLFSNLEQVVEEVGTVTFLAIEAALAASLVGIPATVAIGLAQFFLLNLADFVWDESYEWIQDNKQGLVCAIVNSATSSEANAAINAYIDDNWDKLWLNGAVKLVFTRHTLKQLFDEALPSYTARAGNYGTGYCALCEEPILGTDWYAIPLSGEDWTHSQLTDALYKWCLPALEVTDKYIAGLIIEVECSENGYPNWKTMTRQTAQCAETAGQMFADSAPQYVSGTFARVNGDNITETELVTEFGATLMTSGVYRVFDTARGAIFVEGVQGRTITVTVTHCIVEGSPD